MICCTHIGARRMSWSRSSCFSLRNEVRSFCSSESLSFPFPMLAMSAKSSGRLAVFYWQYSHSYCHRFSTYLWHSSRMSQISFTFVTFQASIQDNPFQFCRRCTKTELINKSGRRRDRLGSRRPADKIAWSYPQLNAITARKETPGIFRDSSGAWRKLWTLT